jgi:hypothetical protein
VVSQYVKGFVKREKFNQENRLVLPRGKELAKR